MRAHTTLGNATQVPNLALASGASLQIGKPNSATESWNVKFRTLETCPRTVARQVARHLALDSRSLDQRVMDVVVDRLLQDLARQ